MSIDKKKPLYINGKDIQKMSYVDFVGFINQWNVLPGAFDTLNRWRVFANVTENSKILEIACTTGFSSRELSILTGASCYGIDTSATSIRSAIKNKEEYAPVKNLSYEIADALSFTKKSKFTHIIIGASLKFFSDQQVVVEKISRLLRKNGYLLASPFFTIKPIPQDLIKKARTIFGITITTESYKEIMWMYKDFEILYLEKRELVLETEKELKHYCTSTIERFHKANPGLTPDALSVAYKRLMKIKRMSNELRPYQGYVVLVLRARENSFSKRFVELF